MQEKKEPDNRLRAVVFDYGKVLSLPPSEAHMCELAELLGIPAGDLQSVYFRFRVPYDRGDIDSHEYWTAVARAGGGKLTDAKIEALTQLDYRMWFRPQQTTLGWVEHIRKLGFRAALLSNMSCDHKQYLIDHCPWLPDFDQRTFSCDIACVKPSPEIYHHCLKGLGLAPSEVLFLDDNADNIKAARELGWHAIIFGACAEVAAEIELRFSISLPLPLA